MMTASKIPLVLFSALLALMSTPALPARAQATDDLVIAQGGKTATTIIVSPEAGKWEKQGALDLQKYIEMMSGAKPQVASTPETIAAALKLNTPLLLVGQEAIKSEPSLQAALDKVKKKNPTLRADAIVARRVGNRVLLAGTNDDSHYYAVAHLLRLWGCRWYTQSEFGECIPVKGVLALGKLDMAYAPPFEVRNFWIAWNGEQEGRPEFMRRNFMNEEDVPSGHEPGLSEYSKDAVPPGKTKFDIAFAEDATVKAIVKSVAPMYAKGESFSLSIDDGVYTSDSPNDKAMKAGLYDKYMLNGVLTDNMMTLYNSVAARLKKAHPDSKAKIGFLAYTNVTIPPQREIIAAAPLVCYLAPIDIDPNHGMDDPNSPPRQEYKEMVYRWSEVMQGRVVIYDYDQGMLVWRDLPDPSHMAFAQDVKHYRDAKILGVATETRNALGTIFLNVYFRGQLTWNPDAEVSTLLAEFYPNFYGPAAAPMEKYWSAIYAAWSNTLVTEHEYMAIPAIYTPELVAQLKQHLIDAEKITASLSGKPNLSRNEKQFVERMKFTRLSFNLIESYTDMVSKAARETDFKAAVAAGARGLAIRKELAEMNSNFTTRVVGVLPETEANGPAWFAGEVAQYRELAKLTDGSKGTLIAKTPLEWAFRRDPNDSGLASGWAYKPLDLTYWNANKAKLTLNNRKDYPTTQWEMLRTDLYAQAQGVRHPDAQSYTGYGWYHTSVPLKTEQTSGKVHLMFPGLFNECWLYVNGRLIAHREFPQMWWISDYKFEWDVDVASALKPGENTIALRFNNPHHFGGIFRRPFLYRAQG